MNINTEVKRMKKTIDELNDVTHDATREFVSKYCDVEKYDAFMSRTSPLLETGILIAIVGIGYNMEIIAHVFRFFLALNVVISGLTLSSIIVGTCVYEKGVIDDDDDDMGYESEDEMDYEDKYDIDEIEDISGNPSESVYISDTTPEGVAFMRYNKYKEGFEYWADKGIQYEYLETMCRKYVKTCRCKNMYVDRKRLLKEKQERLAEEEKRKEENEQMEKEDFEKIDDVDDDDDVFAKLKTNVDKRYDTDKKKKKSANVVDKANKYIYMGKLNEMLPFATTRNDELSETTTKKNVSFSMFKALGLN